MSQYEIVWFRGHRFDRMTVQALMEMENRLGYTLTVLQGSYNGTAVSASAGTHAGGGAVDLAPAKAADKARVGREVGFAMWERQAIPGVWQHHVHGILYGNVKASPGAKRQVTDYLNHRNGLANHAYDGTWRPTHITPYKYKSAAAKPIAVDLSNLRIDFLQALDGDKTFNAPANRVKIIQRRLNTKLGGRDLTVDGVVGPKTLAAWKSWERTNGDNTPNSLPDAAQLRGLLRGTIYYMTP